jgi:hypothetical protein
MGPNYKRFNNKRVLPNHQGQTDHQIKLTPNFTAIITAHGKTKAYLHRFKIIESPECPYGGGN